jgi:hypothetical protein
MEANSHDLSSDLFEKVSTSEFNHFKSIAYEDFPRSQRVTDLEDQIVTKASKSDIISMNEELQNMLKSIF